MILIWYMNADEDFYPRPPRGGRPGQQTANDTPIGISIHALREEGDGRCFAKAYSARLFLSTPSARRATTAPVWRGSKVVRFLSTPSARRATGNRSRHTAGHSDFYPRPPRGGRRGKYKDMIAARIFLSTPSARRATFFRCRAFFGRIISIHALREEGDRVQTSSPLLPPISIHALREEGDPSAKRRSPRRGDFYPRPPRGGRLAFEQRAVRNGGFLSTPSARRATCIAYQVWKNCKISIHALREEGDD